MCVIIYIYMYVSMCIYIYMYSVSVKKTFIAVIFAKLKEAIALKRAELVRHDFVGRIASCGLVLGIIIMSGQPTPP